MKKLFNFDNIGKKIKGLAKWCCWGGIFSAWVTALCMLVQGIADIQYEMGKTLILLSVVSAVVAPFILWIGSWVLYGFGELVDSASKMANQAETAPAPEELPEI